MPRFFSIYSLYSSSSFVLKHKKGANTQKMSEDTLNHIAKFTNIINMNINLYTGNFLQHICVTYVKYQMNAVSPIDRKSVV